MLVSFIWLSFSRFTHVECYSFLWLKSIPLCGYTILKNLLIIWWTLGYFYFLTTTDNDALDIHIQIFVLTSFHFSWVYAKKWYYWITREIYVNLLRNCQNGSTYYILTSSLWVSFSPILQILPVIVIAHLFLLQLSQWIQYGISVWFWLMFSWLWIMLSIFSCANWPLSSFFGGIYSIQCPFLNWVVFLSLVSWILVKYMIIRYMICKDFLPFCQMSFHFLDAILWNTKVVNFDAILSNFCMWCEVGVQPHSYTIHMAIQVYQQHLKDFYFLNCLGTLVKKKKKNQLTTKLRVYFWTYSSVSLI